MASRVQYWECSPRGRSSSALRGARQRLVHRRELAVLNLYEEASKLARADGLKLESDEEIVALGEKRLIAFLHDFLAKQPGVKHVPTITVLYAPPATPGTQAQ